MVYCTVLLLVVFKAIIADNATVFDYHAYLNEMKTFEIYWNHIDNKSIEIKMSAKTTGWIGLGLSANAKMTDSDIFIGWVDDYNFTVYLQDRYTKTQRVEPFMDENQSLTLINGSQIDGVTTIIFKRNKIFCNEQDKNILSGTSRLIFAYSIDGSDIFQFHGLENMGTRSLNFYSDYYLHKNKNNNTMTNEINNYFDLTVNNTNTITDKVGSLYYCKLLKLPTFKQTQHIVQTVGKITPGNEGIVHHMILYHCPNSKVISESHVNTEGLCDEWDENMPSKYCRGGQFLWFSAVGSNAFQYPEHVGVEIGPNSHIQYALLEIHYENGYSLNRSDHSGIRIWYDQRNYSSSNLVVGINSYLPNYHFIPHGVNPIVNYAYCLSQCTKRGFPSDGVTIFAVFFHAHLLGVAMRLRIIRDGVELEPIHEDYGYDFDYQNTVLIEERKLLPNDTLILECYYNTLHKNDSDVTFGGETTLDEMCLVNLLVYPKPRLLICISDFTMDHIVKWSQEAVEYGYLENYNKGRKHWKYFMDRNNSYKWYNNLWNAENYTNKNAALRHIKCLDDNYDQIVENVSYPYDYIPEYDGFKIYENQDECVLNDKIPPSVQILNLDTDKQANQSDNDIFCLIFIFVETILMLVIVI